jgi:uncharacterized protein YfbU (UPF0304 family)
MFDALQRAVRVQDDGSIDPLDVQFPGFDGKTEADYLGYAQFLLERERWPEHLAAARNLDTRAPMLRQYRRMLDEWKRHGRSADLDARDIAAIVNKGK